MAEHEDAWSFAPGHNRSRLTTTREGGRRLNRMQLPFFTVLPPRGFGVLTTTGRVTGRPRRTCVRAVLVGDTAYLVAIAGPRTGWLRNLRADSRVTLRIRGGTVAGQARDVAEDELATAERAYVAYTGPFEFLECLAHLDGRPTREKLRNLHGHWFRTGTRIAVDIGRGDT